MEGMRILIKIVDGEPQAFGSVSTLEDCTGSKDFDLDVSMEDWEASGCEARIENGRVVLGKSREAVFAEAVEHVRTVRHKLLKIYCDRISPMRWETMSEEQKAEAMAYRQALLDITDVHGFPWTGRPESIPWPKVPPFMDDGLSRQAAAGESR